MDHPFYRNQTPIRNYGDLGDPAYFQEPPDDWFVLLTDVVGSTKAIESGRYKEVNTAGSLSVMALANHLGHLDFPFFFGGDGATCLVPPDDPQVYRSLLSGVAAMVHQAYQLDLRLAVIPYGTLRAGGHSMKVGRIRVSDRYTQAVAVGDSLDEAELILKGAPSPYHVAPTEPALEADFSGFTCRWQDYPSPHGETLALIVRFPTPDPALSRQIIQTIESLVGSQDDHHPLRLEASRTAWSRRRLDLEVAAFEGTTRGVSAFRRRFQIRLQVLWTVVARLFRWNLRVGPQGKKLSEVAEENIRSSDFRKFDSSYKLVVSVNPGQRLALVDWLERQKQEGHLFYGVNVSNRATITCLMKLSSGQEVHFVDAADGGYAFAARQLKQQLAKPT